LYTILKIFTLKEFRCCPINIITVDLKWFMKIDYVKIW